MRNLSLKLGILLLVLVTCVATSAVALAQAPLPTAQAPLPSAAQAPPPAAYPPAELDRIVSPVALYPDPLLAQVLAASTYPDQIADAAHWADEHHYLTGTALTAAMSGDQVPWDPSVQALIPFPSVLDMMASAMPWTQELGNAFLAQHDDVMDAVQRERKKAVSYGYLRSNAQVVVNNGPYVEILPANPNFIVVPAYDPLVVYAPPRPGFMVGGAIHFGFGVTLGAAYAPWGWGATRFAWGTHAVIINNAPWGRVWGNRFAYHHPYAAVPHFNAARPLEQHRLMERSTEERNAAREGRERREDHRPRG